MSDVETLVATFQTQLSDVMETVLKTAMYEVTKLVEDGFMEQLRLRSHDAESLRLQLRWTEEKLRDGGRRCVTCGKAGVDVAEDGPGDTGYGVLDGCSPKRETNSPDALGSCRQGAMPKVVSTHAADEPTCIVTPMRDARETEDSVKPHAKMKVEEDDLPSCSVEQQEGWPRAPDGGDVSTFHRPNEVADSQPNQTLRSSKDISRTAIRQDLPTSAPSTFTTDREDPVPLLDSKSAYLTLTTDDTLSLDNEPTFPRGSPKQKGLKQVHLEPIYKDNCNSQHYMPHIPSKAKNDISSVGDVVVKQEILVDSCGDEDEDLGKKEVTLSTKAFSSSSVNKHNARPEVIKQKQISHEPAAQEVIKKHAKMGSSLTFKAAVQHLQPPMTKPHQTHSTTTSTARSLHFNPLNRTPSTSKSAPPPLSAPQAHLSAKQSMVLNRTGSPWVNIKTNYQTANAHQNPGSHPHHQQGPRNFLRCGLCGKCFPHPSNLKAHLQTHTGERPFCCSLCGRSFTKLSNLKAHRRVHTGERPYCCLACGKRFTQKCNLKRHQRIHMDV